jgi:hypothetical protein
MTGTPAARMAAEGTEEQTPWMATCKIVGNSKKERQQAELLTSAKDRTGKQINKYGGVKAEK